MGIVRVIDRVRDDVQAALEAKAAPDDVVEFDALVVPAHDGDGVEMAVSLYVSVECPEIACGQEEHDHPGGASIALLTVPLLLMSTRGEVAEVIDKVWERLTFNRIRLSVGEEHESFYDDWVPPEP